MGEQHRDGGDGTQSVEAGKVRTIRNDGITRVGRMRGFARQAAARVGLVAHHLGFHGHGVDTAGARRRNGMWLLSRNAGRSTMK